jgi:2-polyprenyl-3-methyl-5-hydroxy-6-metoxy-1,4-benzoquinol methylase
MVLGFLGKSGSLWRQEPVASAFIDKTSPTSMASIGRFLAGPEFLRLFLEDPAGCIRRGGAEGLANKAPEEPIWVTFAESMTPVTVAAAKATAAHIAAWAAPPRRVLDVAAGAGMFGICVAQACPEASIVAVDWRDVVAVAGRNAERASVGERYRTLAGDAFGVDWGGGYDLVLLAHILHHFDHASCVALLRRVRDSLAPGGRATIIEFVPNADRITLPIPASFAFMMVPLDNRATRSAARVRRHGEGCGLAPRSRCAAAAITGASDRIAGLTRTECFTAGISEAIRRRWKPGSCS